MTKPASWVAISGESPNDALSIYFGDATLASNFVARWCACSKIETAGGVFRVCEKMSQHLEWEPYAAPDT
jgi:hypothetical protein